MAPAQKGYNSEEGNGIGQIGPYLVRAHNIKRTPLAGPLVKTCRMRDVVLVDFDLTNLYDTSRSARSHARENINADEPESRSFEDGTAIVTAEIRKLCQQIKGCKTNRNGLPFRQELKNALPEHFNARTSMLKNKSPLARYFGDKRLFTEQEWNYLGGKDGDGGR